MPLYLLDAELDENDPVDRWITARLYEGNPLTRLGQYGLLGIGSVRMLRALGIEPGVLHFNEGHPALAALELAAGSVAAGESLDDALAAARARCVFTTHTPVPAGNEVVRDRLVPRGVCRPLRAARDGRRALSRPLPYAAGHRRVAGDDTAGAAPRSRRANAVSLRHEQVAREMWRPLYGDAPADDVPITHVTNGVHLPTFLASPVRALLDRHLGDDWLARAADPETWAPVDDIPDEELWARAETTRGASSSTTSRRRASRTGCSAARTRRASRRSRRPSPTTR